MVDSYSLAFLDNDWELSGVTIQYSMAFARPFQLRWDDILKGLGAFIATQWKAVGSLGGEASGERLDGLEAHMDANELDLLTIWVAEPVERSRRLFIELVPGGSV